MKDKKKVIIIVAIIIIVMVCGIVATIGKQSKTNNEETTITTEKNTEKTEITTTEKLSENNSATINLNDYISVSFVGYNNEGNAAVSFDKEQFLLDNINLISFNQTNLKAYRDLYVDDDKSAAYAICRFFSPEITKYENLSNGDSIEVVWDYNEEKIKTYFNCNISCASEKFVVEGLEDKNITTINVPDFRGKMYEEIKNTEEYKNILVFKTEYIDSGEKMGTIVSQNLPSGTEVTSLNPRVITLKISNGLEVPNVEGLKLQDAINELKTSGFKNVKTESAKIANTEKESNTVYKIVYEDKKSGTRYDIPDDKRLSTKDAIILYYYGEYIENTEQNF